VRALVSVTAYAAVILGTVVLGSLSVLLAWLPPRGSAVLFFARLWAHVVLAGAGVRLAVEVDPEVKPERGYVFLANHESYLDVPVLLAALPVPVRFAAKKSLFRLPFFGWAIRAGGFIPVDRENRRQAVEVFTAAAALLRSGASVALFPEGTRSPDGRLHRFQRGGFLIAQKCGAAIVPVGLSGTFEVLPRQRRTFRPGPVRVRVGAPIETAGYPVSRKDDLIARVRDQIAVLAGIEDEPGGTAC